jgi:hypothetical protein
MGNEIPDMTKTIIQSSRIDQRYLPDPCHNRALNFDNLADVPPGCILTAYEWFPHLDQSSILMQHRRFWAGMIDG